MVSHFAELVTFWNEHWTVCELHMFKITCNCLIPKFRSLFRYIITKFVYLQIVVATVTHTNNIIKYNYWTVLYCNRRYRGSRTGRRQVPFYRRQNYNVCHDAGHVGKRDVSNSHLDEQACLHFSFCHVLIFSIRPCWKFFYLILKTEAKCL